MVERTPLTLINGRPTVLPTNDYLTGGVPTGGTSGQVLTKTGAGDFATGWADPAGGAAVPTIGRDIALRNNHFLF